MQLGGPVIIYRIMYDDGEERLLEDAWTCAMHPDPARRGCEVAEEGLGEDEVTTQVEVEQGMCGTPGCKYADFHTLALAPAGRKPRKANAMKG